MVACGSVCRLFQWPLVMEPAALGSSRVDDQGGGCAEVRRWSELVVDAVEHSSAACGLYGGDLEVLQDGLAPFFQDEGPSMEGDRKKPCLSPRLAVFQILVVHGGVRLFGFEILYFWACW